MLAFSLYAQNNAENKPNSLNTSKPKPEQIHLDDDSEDLDELFYNRYFMVSPKQFEKEEEKKSSMLLTNLVRVFKNEVAKRDHTISKETLRDISSSTIKYKKVSEDSEAMKGIQQELKYIYFTKFMYIVKYKKYMSLILFQFDPGLHLQSPSQIEFLKIKDFDAN